MIVPMAGGRSKALEVSAPPWKTQYDRSELTLVPCPFCGSTRSDDVAVEFGITIACCRACHLVFTLTPLPHSQGHYGASEEGVRAKYGRIFEGEAAHPRTSNYHEHLATLERLTDDRRLLDVGSHCGFFLNVARDRGWDVTGLDPSAVNSRLARDVFGLDVRTGTLEEVDLPPGSFGVATLVDVFEHISQPRELLDSIARVLRPGGRLFIKVPNVRYVLAKNRLLRRAKSVSDVFDAREHLAFYSTSTLRKVLESAAFEVEYMGVPSPIQAGSKLQRAVRASGPAVASRLPRGTTLPLATDIVAVGRSWRAPDSVA